jgi:hypothetical protein
MKNRGAGRLVRRFGLVLAIAALLAPGAQAARGYPSITPQARSDLAQPRSENVSSSSSSSSWGDARIGGSVVLAVMLLGFAIVLTRYGRRSRRPAAT